MRHRQAGSRNHESAGIIFMDIYIFFKLKVAHLQSFQVPIEVIVLLLLCRWLAPLNNSNLTSEHIFYDQASAATLPEVWLHCLM